ncbi:hypothetical protein ACPA0F_18675 [Solibacillus silvestris]
MINLEAFQQWQSEGKRSVKIELGNIYDNENVSVWVYDYDLQIGQLVSSVDEIDLEGRRKAQLEEVMKELSQLSKSRPAGHN